MLSDAEVEKFLTHEFRCYYLADEFPEKLSDLAPRSAARLVRIWEPMLQKERLLDWREGEQMVAFLATLENERKEWLVGLLQSELDLTVEATWAEFVELLVALRVEIMERVLLSIPESPTPGRGRGENELS